MNTEPLSFDPRMNPLAKEAEPLIGPGGREAEPLVTGSHAADAARAGAAFPD